MGHVRSYSLLYFFTCSSVSFATFAMLNKRLVVDISINAEMIGGDPRNGFINDGNSCFRAATSDSLVLVGSGKLGINGAGNDNGLNGGFPRWFIPSGNPFLILLK